MAMQQEFHDLKGKWALILGASSGFGAAAALALAKSGVNICGVHLDRKSTMGMVEEVVAGIKSAGAKSVFFNVNASDPEKRKEIIAAMKAETPSGFHVLLHSLAFGALKPLFSEDALSQAQLEMTLDVMAHSLVYWTQDLVKAGMLSRGGRVFAMTSTGSQRVWTSYGAVSAAKASLESYIRQMSLELAPLGITANAICAGVTDTPALRKIPGHEKMIELASAKNPYKRLTTPQDVAQTIVALSLPQTYWLTGNVLGVDGGEMSVD